MPEPGEARCESVGRTVRMFFTFIPWDSAGVHNFSKYIYIIMIVVCFVFNSYMMFVVVFFVFPKHG